MGRKKKQVWRPVLLFLEQVVESGAGVGGAARHRDRGWGGSVARRGGIARDSHTRLEQLALVGLVLRHDPYGDRLEALKARRRLEVRALLAAVERGVALRAVTFPVNVFG